MSVLYRGTIALAFAIILGFSFFVGSPVQAAPSDVEPKDPADVVEKFQRTKNPIADQYVVVLNEELPGQRGRDVASIATELAIEHGAQIRFVYEHALRGFAIQSNEAQAKAIARSPLVSYVIEDGMAEPNAAQQPATWGLDRIDQRALPLNNTYNYVQNGTGVHVYVIDSGIYNHNDFGGRIRHDYTAVNDGYGAGDCNGHGTHVAGTIGSGTWGVSKNVILHSVRVFPCSGGAAFSVIINAMDWVTANKQKPAVANMSLSGSYYAPLNTALQNSMNAGITYVVAAGNESTDACSRSPASERTAITVGATTTSDARGSYSNYGTCVDLFAPGSAITSTWNTGPNSTAVLTGTSMATPHVAGLVANFLQTHPNASPAFVQDIIVSNVSQKKLSNIGTGSPNHLAYAFPSATGHRAFFRYYSASATDHFYTKAWGELGAGKGSYKLENVTGYLMPTNAAGTVPLYRYYNSHTTDHFFTTSWAELGSGGGNWRYEGVAGYVPTAKTTETTELYRYVNTSNGDHFYTTGWGELGAGNGTWRYEGVQCYVYKNP